MTVVSRSPFARRLAGGDHDTVKADEPACHAASLHWKVDHVGQRRATDRGKAMPPRVNLYFVRNVLVATWFAALGNAF